MKTQLLLMSLLLCFGCHCKKKAADAQFTPSYAPGPHAIVYKTVNDYSQNVAVTLSADKSEIVSYPHPSDVFTNAKLALPTSLADGYLLDNRGINPNVAFLKYTYQEYSLFTEAPPLKILYNSIIDKNPLTEIWDCGLRSSFSDIEKQLNELIKNNKFKSTFKSLK